MGGDTLAARLVGNRLDGAFDAAWYLTRYPDIGGRNPRVHYAAHGAAEGRDPHPWFDAAYYAREYPETRGQIPADNYLREGVALRRRTHPERGFCVLPPLGRPLRIATLLLRHGTQRYPDATGRLESVLASSLAGAERRTVVIDNALPPDTPPQKIDGRTVLIPGDNSSWEFSGWDAGLRFLGEEALREHDFIHFVTDAFQQPGAEFVPRLDTTVLEALRFGPAVAGHIDFYNETPVLAGRPVPCWIRSSYFFLRPAELRALGSLVTFPNRDGIFSGDARKPFQEGGPVDDLLAGYITGWLTGEGTGQGVQWHSRFDLDAATLVRFEEKARAILNELSLSARLRELGCWMADASWSAVVLRGLARGRWFEESWRGQIQNRPSGLG